MKNNSIKVGILGFGTVGSGVIRILMDNKNLIEKKTGFPIIIKKIADIDLKRKRNIKVPKELLTSDAHQVINDRDINIIVELIGGVKDAKRYVISAIKNRKNVVTSNKELIAKYGDEILNLAERNKVDIRFEGSVGGGIPILRPIMECLAGNRISEIIGIVNGTTNYILTKMQDEKKNFHQVLKDAIDAGYAEVDPKSDIEGYDASYKITILAGLAFGMKIPLKKVYREGIANITQKDIEYADEFGYRIKLLAIAKSLNDEVEIRVHPALILKTHPISSISGVFNAIFVKGDSVGEVMFYGQGAGSLPTGSAVVGDIIEIGRNIKSNALERLRPLFEERKRIKDIKDIETKYYLRMIVKDRPGVLAKIAGIFSKNRVSIAQVLQKNAYLGFAEIVFLTHIVKEKNFQNALKRIKILNVVKEVSQVLRVEE